MPCLHHLRVVGSSKIIDMKFLCKTRASYAIVLLIHYLIFYHFCIKTGDKGHFKNMVMLIFIGPKGRSLT